MKINTDEKKIQEILTRGVENVYPSRQDFEKALKNGKQLTIYNGIDPTGPTLHIGHGVVLLKLRQLQELGHKIILLIGDFTGMIGDPTDKTATRKKLTRKEVLENCKNYAKQAGKILDMKKVDLKYNSKWLGKLNFADIVELASHFTVQQMYARDMFRNRMNWKAICEKCGELMFLGQTTAPPWVGRCQKCMHAVSFDNTSGVSSGLTSPSPIYLHEFLYPLMQAYDSVAMDVDVEIGGNDQTFNMLAGRDLMKDLKQKEKFVLTTKLLVDPTGKKMGKTEGNMVTLMDTAEEMYGKVMSWPDTLMPVAFEICTRVPMDEIKNILAGDPRDAKMKLAREIVTLYHGAKNAVAAEENFVKIFQKKEAPEEVVEVKIGNAKINILELLVETKLAASKGEARRLVEQGGVKVGDKIIDDINAVVEISAEGILIQKGKRHFVKVKS
ncbi:MAG: tyrosine--tRNA ligase [Patescibacteria group bacterium]|jgi:tyrosyl-tRNA synthetase